MVVAEGHAPLPMLPSVLLQLPRWAHAQQMGLLRGQKPGAPLEVDMQGRPLGLMGLYACPQATTQDSGAALTLVSCVAAGGSHLCCRACPVAPEGPGIGRGDKLGQKGSGLYHRS